MRIELRAWSSRFRDEREELALVAVLVVRTAEPRRGPVRRREERAIWRESLDERVIGYECNYGGLYHNIDFYIFFLSFFLQDKRCTCMLLRTSGTKSVALSFPPTQSETVGEPRDCLCLGRLFCLGFSLGVVHVILARYPVTSGQVTCLQTLHSALTRDSLFEI